MDIYILGVQEAVSKLELRKALETTKHRLELAYTHLRDIPINLIVLELNKVAN